MSEAPTNVREFTEAAIGSSLREWMMAEADRIGDSSPDGSTMQLIPPLAVAGNPILGLDAQKVAAEQKGLFESNEQCCLRMWLCDREDYARETVAHVVQSLKWSRNPVSITCSGNRSGISYRFVTHQDDVLALRNVLAGTYPKAHLEQEDVSEFGNILQSHASNHLRCAILRPPLPYWGIFEDRGSHSGSLYSTMACLEGSEYAVYQVIFVPIPSAWCSLIRTMARTEELVSPLGGGHADWLPSRDAVRNAQEKLSNPLFAASVRIGLFGGRPELGRSVMSSLMLSIAGIHFSGAPLSLFSGEEAMRRGVAADSLRQSFVDGRTFIHGAVVCPSELALLVPMPDKEAVANPSYALDRVPALVAGLDHERGIVLGNEIVFGKERRVVWPERLRPVHMVVSGVTGKGKTFFLSGMCSGIANGNPNEGLAIIDPHETAIVEFSRCVDEDRLDDCILHDPMDDEYVLCLPLMDCPDLEQVDAAVSNISRQFFALFSRSDMGFNIERGMRSAVRTVLLCPDLSLTDVRTLLAPGNRGEECREKVCSELTDDMLIDYWTSDFDALDRGTIGRIRSRFEHILEPKRLRMLLANKIRKISYREIIDQGLIFLAMTCPGSAGHDLASTLGTLHLTGLHAAAPTRAQVGAGCPIFTIVAEEFGNYSNPKTVPHALRTLRRCNVSEILVTQNVYALPEEVRHSVGNIGTHVVFQQGWDDAHHYFKTFCGMVPAEDFITKEVGEGYAKVGNRLATIKCPLPERVREASVLEEIRENTRKKYCIPRKELGERLIDEKHASLEEMKELDLI